MNTTTRRDFLTTACLAAGGLLLSPEFARAQPPARRLRRNIRTIEANDPDYLLRFRRAFAQLHTTVGDDGFQAIAGYHGEPGWFCHKPNEEILFLAWHRAYMLRLEDALRKIDGTLALPFWDWTDSQSEISGIPKAYSDLMFEDGGQQQPNPLASGVKSPIGPDARTQRAPQAASGLGVQRDLVTNAQNATSYAGLNARLTVPHDNLHVWVRGDMGGVEYAAYDPIFWAHHATVDRQWAEWQSGPRNRNPNATTMQMRLEPFNKTVAEVIDFRTTLNYEYEGLPSVAAGGQLVQAGPLANFPEIAAISPVAGPFLFVRGMRHSERSIIVHVFIDQQAATLTTAGAGSDNLAGMFGIFGHKRKAGVAAAHGHGAGDGDAVAVLNLGPTMKRLKDKGISPKTVKLVAADLEGKAIPVSELPFDEFFVSR